MSTALAESFAVQVAWCDAHGAPFTARVIEAAWQDWLDGGALRRLLPDWPGDPRADAVPLRVAGALHALALDRLDADLVRLYPPQAATFDTATGPRCIAAALDRFAARVADTLARPPQTNEIGRSALLLAGFAHVAARTGLPLALREIGASAGLNLIWDRYRYEIGALRWGDPASPVLIRAALEQGTPVLPDRIDVVSRAGCDVAPIDLRDPGAAMRLTSYVWPEQSERLARLRAAIPLAQALGVDVERIDAAAFVAREFAAPRAGETRVLYHSVVWQYLPQTTKDAIQASMQAAAARATPDAPVAHLSFELARGSPHASLRLQLWPGNVDETLADAHPHGSWIRWHAPAA